MTEAGLRIEIELARPHQALGPGRHVVAYHRFAGGELHCSDARGNRLRIPRDRFRLVRVWPFETRVSRGGWVSARVGERWVNLGPLFAEPHADREPPDPERYGSAPVPGRSHIKPAPR
ncbi:MAG: hypothetical protein ACOC8E_00010 [Planctomycetota bacterium]